MGCGMRGKWENNGRKSCGELCCSGNDESDLLTNIILMSVGHNQKGGQGRIAGA